MATLAQLITLERLSANPHNADVQACTDAEAADVVLDLIIDATDYANKCGPYWKVDHS